MRMGAGVFAAAIVAGFMSFGHSAQAADVLRAAPTPPPIVPAASARPWNALYLGGGGGYAWGTIDGHAHIDISNAPSEDYYPSFDANSWLAYGIVGGDLQLGDHVVLGAFADYTWLDDFSGSQTTDFGGGFHKTFSAQIDSIITVAGRIGIAHNRSLFYGLAGWSWAKGSLSEFEGCNIFCDNLDYSGSVKADGWTVGGGLEHLIEKHLSARLEYRYTHLDTDTISGICSPQVNNCGATYEGWASAAAGIHSVRAALVLRLGG